MYKKVVAWKKTSFQHLNIEKVNNQSHAHTLVKTQIVAPWTLSTLETPKKPLDSPHQQVPLIFITNSETFKNTVTKIIFPYKDVVSKN